MSVYVPPETVEFFFETFFVKIVANAARQKFESLESPDYYD